MHIPETNAEGQEVIKTGKLWLIDLAGSENISRRAVMSAGRQTCTMKLLTMPGCSVVFYIYTLATSLTLPVTPEEAGIKDTSMACTASSPC